MQEILAYHSLCFTSLPANLSRQFLGLGCSYVAYPISQCWRLIDLVGNIGTECKSAPHFGCSVWWRWWKWRRWEQRSWLVVRCKVYNETDCCDWQQRTIVCSFFFSHFQLATIILFLKVNWLKFDEIVLDLWHGKWELLLPWVWWMENSWKLVFRMISTTYVMYTWKYMKMRMNISEIIYQH